MTFADATISRLDIVGPPGLLHCLAAMRLYTFRCKIYPIYTRILNNSLLFYRDTMPIYPTEASWNLSTSSSPEPLYHDKNITIYGIPILPFFESASPSTSTSEPIPVAQSPDPHSKRKREASPESPSKRPALMTEAVELPERPPALCDIIQQACFTPTQLTGETAQEWRRLMIDMMFPRVKDKMEAQKRKQRKERDRDRLPSPSKKSEDKQAGLPNNMSSRSTDADMDTSDNKGPAPPNNGSTSSNVSVLVMLRCPKKPLVYTNAISRLPDFTNNFLNSFIKIHRLHWHHRPNLLLHI
jgi:ribonuclease Z